MTKKPFENTENLPMDAVKHMELAKRWIDQHPDDAHAQARATARKMAESIAENDATTAAPPLELQTWSGAAVPAREWLIANWLPAGRLTLFTGEGGVGKSRLMLQAAAGVASGGGDGDAWIEAPATLDALRLGSATVIGGIPVVYATWEDELGEVWRRLSQISGDAAPWVTPERLRNL